MKAPSIINDGAEKVNKFITVLMWLCLSLAFSLFIMLVVLFMQHQEIQLLKGKVKNDSISIQSYKAFINPTQ